jgi:hypothetical protein
MTNQQRSVYAALNRHCFAEACTFAHEAGLSIDEELLISALGHTFGNPGRGSEVGGFLGTIIASALQSLPGYRQWREDVYGVQLPVQALPAPVA